MPADQRTSARRSTLLGSHFVGWRSQSPSPAPPLGPRPLSQASAAPGSRTAPGGVGLGRPRARRRARGVMGRATSAPPRCWLRRHTSSHGFQRDDHQGRSQHAPVDRLGGVGLRLDRETCALGREQHSPVCRSGLLVGGCRRRSPASRPVSPGGKRAAPGRRPRSRGVPRPLRRRQGGPPPLPRARSDPEPPWVGCEEDAGGRHQLVDVHPEPEEVHGGRCATIRGEPLEVRPL